MISLFLSVALAASSNPLSKADQNLILKNLYPTARINNGVAQSTIPEIAIDDEGKPLECGKASSRVIVHTSAKRLDPKAPSNEVLLLTATACEKHSCSACGAVIGMARLKKSATGWQRVGEYRFPTIFGEYGAFGPNFVPSFVSIAPQALGLRINVSATRQGYTDAGAHFFHITPTTELKRLGGILETTTNETSDRCYHAGEKPSLDARLPCFKKKLDIELTNRLVNDFYAITVKVKGTEDKNDTIVAVDRVDSYQYDGKTYALATPAQK